MFKRASTVLMLMMVSLSFSGIVNAASTAAVTKQQTATAKQQNVQQLVKQYREKIKQLQQIREKAIKANPNLTKEQKQFETQVKTAIKAHGYDIDKGEKRVQKMVAEIKSKKTSKAERKTLMKKFGNERSRMIKARDAAFKDSKIRKAGEKLQHDTLLAMEKQNSHTKQLISQMDALRGKLRAAMPHESPNSRHKH